MHFYDGLSNKRCPKKGPERDQEMTTGDASQVKERIWYLLNKTMPINTNTEMVQWRCKTKIGIKYWYYYPNWQ